MTDIKYCLCCDEDVPYNYVERNQRKELTCSYCGFTLDVQKLWEVEKPSEGHALVAEDSKYIRDIILNVLKTSGFSQNPMAFNNGLELISAYSRLISERTLVDIVIIDLNMPVMDGMTAARTIRSMETQHNISAAPIVFFSAVKADDFLKQQMELLSPASYMYKGSEDHPDKLSERVEQLVSYLIKRYKKNSLFSDRK